MLSVALCTCQQYALVVIVAVAAVMFVRMCYRQALGSVLVELGVLGLGNATASILNSPTNVSVALGACAHTALVVMT